MEILANTEASEPLFLRAEGRKPPMNHFRSLIPITIGALIDMTQTVSAASDAATDPRIDPQVRAFLADVPTRIDGLRNFGVPSAENVLAML